MFKPNMHYPRQVSTLSVLSETDWSEVIRQDRQLQDLMHSVECFYREKLAITTKQWICDSNVRLDASLPANVGGNAICWIAFPPHRLQSAEISLKPGRSKLHTAGVLTHEMFHVISAARGLKLGKQLEEGAANLAQYLYLKHHGKADESRVLQHAMHCDSDPIYGDGFRIARRVYKEKGGFQACLDELQVIINRRNGVV